MSSLLLDGLAALDLDFNQHQLDCLNTYLELLQKWNRAYNLTAITDADKMVSYHVLDSLAIAHAFGMADFCLDVGTGAGLPGIPLAIMLPQSSWVLLDSNGKKTRFVQQAIASCQLSNVKVVQARVQDYHAGSPFDVIVSRAYASLQDYVFSVSHLWQPNTRLISMKTELSDAEVKAMHAHRWQLDVVQLQVPGIGERRSLVSLRRQIT